MKKVYSILVILILIFAYQFANKEREDKPTVTQPKAMSKVEKLVTFARSFKGVGYKFGGEDRNGMDCSGVVFTSYKQLGITLPRSSRGMSGEGKNVDLEDVQLGDLLFFDIDRLEGKVNHVGLVTSIVGNDVFFIHSTTKKGVIISSINESYWKEAFLKAKRILK